MPNDSLPPNDASLARYLAGDALPDEQARVETYLHSRPAATAVLDRLRQQPLHPSATSEFDMDATWRRIAHDIGEQEKPSRPSRRTRWSVVAGAALSLSVLGVAMLHHTAITNRLGG